MARELPTYRLNIARLNKKFPGRERYNLNDLCELTGRDKRTVKELIPLYKEGMKIEEVAKALAWTGRDCTKLSIEERYNGRMPTPFNLYEDNLKRLDEFFPDMEILNIADLARFTGRDRRVIREIFPFAGDYICKVNFANMLARLGLKQK